MLTKSKILKTFFIASLAVIALFGYMSYGAQSRTKVYYQGEAIVYKDKLHIATVNTGSLELFVLEGESLVRAVTFKPAFVSLPKGSGSFHDVTFRIINGNLYMYLTDGRYLYQYRANNAYQPILEIKKKDNSWDWFMSLSKTDEHLVTVGNNGVKYWDDSLEVVIDYKLDYEKHENVNVSPDGKHIYVLIGDAYHVYETESREVKAKLQLKSKEASIKGIYSNSDRSELYVTDDEAIKVFNYKGDFLRGFKHTSDFGFDVESSQVSDAVYFSDGIGIVKSDKITMKPLDWVYTTDIGGGGGWAMDIAVVEDSRGDKIVVFNNHEILVLNHNLDLIDYFRSSERDESPIENLALSIDKNSVVPGEYVTVRGQGFAINEDIILYVQNNKWHSRTDNNGRFSKTIEMPYMRSQRTDIKVDGASSNLTYSIAIEVR